MRKFILHVGQMKSGTTYIQNILCNNREELNHKNWVYPGSLLNQQHACYSICGSNIPWVTDENALERYGNDLLESVSQKDSNLIVSAECLSSLSADGIEKFLKIVGPPDKIIVTVRGLLNALPSAWQQGIKGGSNNSIAEFYATLLKNRPSGLGLWKTYSYGNTVSLWSKFAPVDVIVVPHKSQDKNALWELFLSASDLPKLKELSVQQSRSNHSVNFETAELLRCFNSRLKSLGYSRKANERFNNCYLKDFVFAHSSINGTKISYIEKYADHLNMWNQEEFNLMEQFATRILGKPDDIFEGGESMQFTNLQSNELSEQAIQHIMAFVIRKTKLDSRK